MTKGIYAYDFGDKSGMTPLLKMDTLGHDFIPPGIHAGGLRYHGMAPLVSLLHRASVVEAVSYPQLKCFEAAIPFARAEGLIVAPETSHAVCCVVDEALKAKEEGKEKVILFNLSGHGHFDMAAYEKYFAGEFSITNIRRRKFTKPWLTCRKPKWLSEDESDRTSLRT